MASIPPTDADLQPCETSLSKQFVRRYVTVSLSLTYVLGLGMVAGATGAAPSVFLWPMFLIGWVWLVWPSLAVFVPLLVAFCYGIATDSRITGCVAATLLCLSALGMIFWFLWLISAR